MADQLNLNPEQVRQYLASLPPEKQKEFLSQAENPEVPVSRAEITTNVYSDESQKQAISPLNSPAIPQYPVDNSPLAPGLTEGLKQASEEEKKHLLAAMMHTDKKVDDWQKYLNNILESSKN